MSDIKIKLVKDIQDLSDGSILAPAGTIANFVSYEGDYIIAALTDGSVSFPVDPDEYTYITEDYYMYLHQRVMHWYRDTEGKVIVEG